MLKKYWFRMRWNFVFVLVLEYAEGKKRDHKWLTSENKH